MKRQDIKKYFVTGAKPTQAQFGSLFDSIIFKDENGDTIPASRVTGLEQAVALAVASALDGDNPEIKLGSQVECTWLNDSHTQLSLKVDDEEFELDLAQGGEGGSSVSGSWNDAGNVFTLTIDGTDYTLDFSNVGTGGGGTGAAETYSNSNPTTIAVGGIGKGATFANKTMKEMFDMLLYPYVAIKNFSISTNQSGVKEKGVEITISEVTPSFTAGSKNITKFEVFSDSGYTTSLKSNTTGAKITSLSVKGSTSLAVYAKLTDGDTTLEASSVVTFVDPYYTGILAAATSPTSDQVKALTKKVESKANKTYAFTGSGYPCIAYPKSYGALKSIKDANNTDATGDFQQYEVNVAVASGTVAYYVYVQKGASTGLSNYNYTFNI